MFWSKYQMLCANEGKSPNAVAKLAGISSGTITGWKNGNSPSNDSLKKVADYFGISVDALMDDDNKDSIAKKPTVITVFDSSGSMGARGLTKELKEKLKESAMTLSVENPVLVPVYESVSAGFGALARNEVIEHVPCILPPWEADEYIGIKVEGDSMYPKIEDGDTVIVRKQTSVDSGTIAVVLVDGEEGYVKRVEYGPDWINLVSLNPMYAPIRFKGPDVTRVSVQGRVTKVIKDV